MLMLTGCRSNEIATLRWDDVDRTAGELRLGDFEGEVASYEAVIERGSKRGAWEKGSAAGLACLLKAMRLAEIGRADEARVACGTRTSRIAPPFLQGGCAGCFRRCRRR